MPNSCFVGFSCLNFDKFAEKKDCNMGVVSETPYGACIQDKYFFFSYEAVTETDGNLMWIKSDLLGCQRTSVQKLQFMDWPLEADSFFVKWL